MKFSIKSFFSTCDQIDRKLRIWSHLLKKSLMENFIFCAVLNLGKTEFSMGFSIFYEGLYLNSEMIPFHKVGKRERLIIFPSVCLF